MSKFAPVVCHAAPLSLFKHAEGGNVALIAGVFLSLVAFISIGAVDLSGIERSRAHLQLATDAAALAAATAPDTQSWRQTKRAARRVLRANLEGQSGLSGVRIGIERTREGVEVLATGRFDTIVSDIFGGADTRVNARAVAVREDQGMEFVLVFDATNSMMGGSRWSTAVAASTEMLNRVDGAAAAGDFFATFLPIYDRLPIPASKTNWLNGPAPSDWTGCVMPRLQPVTGFAFAQSDDGPAARKFDPAPADEVFVTGHRPHCARAGAGPTGRVSEIRAAMDAARPAGTGDFYSAMAWAWRYVSPEWRGEWGSRNYPSEYGDRHKVIVLASDFQTTLYDNDMSGSAGGSFGWNMATREAFEHFEHLCGRIKRAGVEIHVIQVEGNPHAVPYARACASSAQHYHEGNDSASITAAFQGIGAANGARLVR